MKTLEIMPRGDKRLYSAMVKRQAEIRRAGRGTFTRAGRKRAGAARWKHVRYRGSIDLRRDASELVTVAIKSPDKGDEARLLSAFLGWIDRHFGDQVRTVNIRYQ
jgi:hypothetical protein